MTKLLRYILCYCLIIISIGCTTAKIPTANINQIDSILFFFPVTHIGMIYNGNEAICDSSLSGKAKENLILVIKEYIPKRIKIIQPEFDSLTQNKIDASVFAFYKQISTRKRKDTIPVTFPPFLDSIMNKNELSYGLCLLYNGYIRTDENF